MFVIDDKIVSSDIIRQHFLCDLSCCKGECCVAGSSGAPVTKEEAEVMELEFENYKKYMKQSGVETLEREGFSVIDGDGEATTPLIGGGGECAFTYEHNGVTLCAIEKAWSEGETEFRKPISCHLYPIRVQKFNNGTIGLHYQRWDICNSAIENGRKKGVAIYVMLKEALVRAYGEEFYLALEAAAEHLEDAERS